jgi:protein-S-isoprenylcysteine O-methyltransferase Ste14
LRPIPPLLFLMTILGMIALGRFLPLGSWLEMPWRHAGFLLIAAGLVLPVWGILTFRRMNTPVHPGEGHARAIVDQGPYRFTRNPMYLGMTIILIGIAVRLGTWSPILGVPVFMILVEHLWIRREEHWLTEAFGETYTQYRKRVRRWF